MMIIFHTRDGLECTEEVPNDAGPLIKRPVLGLYNPVAQHLQGKAKYDELSGIQTRTYERQGWKEGLPLYFERG